MDELILHVKFVALWGSGRELEEMFGAVDGNPLEYEASFAQAIRIRSLLFAPGEVSMDYEVVSIQQGGEEHLLLEDGIPMHAFVSAFSGSALPRLRVLDAGEALRIRLRRVGPSGSGRRVPRPGELEGDTGFPSFALAEGDAWLPLVLGDARCDHRLVRNAVTDMVECVRCRLMAASGSVESGGLYVHLSSKGFSRLDGASYGQLCAEGPVTLHRLPSPKERIR